MIGKQWVHQSVCCGVWRCLSRLDKAYLHPIPKVVSSSTPERLKFSSIKQFSLLPILMLVGMLAGCGGANPSPPLAAPNIADVSEQTTAAGTPLTTIVFANTGGAPGSNGCTISPNLPASLEIGLNATGSSCQISGSATAMLSRTPYTVTATNVTGFDTATVTIAIAAPALIAPANFAPLISGSQPLREGIAIANNGMASMQNSCVFSSLGQTSQMLDEFSLITDGNACRITGTPITISTRNSYQLRATNDQGRLVAIEISIEVLEEAPGLQVLAAQRYPTGALISVELVNAGGGKLTECSVNKPLPNGLSVTTNAGNDSCVITGTPDTITTATDFEITATNAIDSSTVTVNIAVVSGVASFADPGPLVYVVDDSVNESFTNTNAVGSRVSSCTGALPVGLSVDAIVPPGNGCTLAGIPTTTTEQASYTITATNDNGDAPLTLDITVNPAPPNLQAPDAQRYPTGAPISVELVNAGGGELTECSVNKPLPNGLSVTTNADNDSCVISGIPDTITTATDFEITATNITGSSTITASIAVVSGVASFAPFEALVYVVGDSVNESFANTNAVGSRVSSCTGTLPAGLSVDALALPGNGCALTGKPTTTEQASYTVTATNDNGDTTLTLDITVNPFPPNLQALDAQRYPTGAPVNVELINTGGGELTECSVNKPLPNGLSVTTNADNDSCVIAGTPDTITTATDFEITATNITDPSTVTVSIAVVSGVASFAPFEALVYVVGDSVNESFTNTNAVGSRVSSCTGTLPAGLSVDALALPGNGCALTGKLTTITEQASYTVTAANDNGDTLLTLDITVNPAVPNLGATSAQTYTQNNAITALVLTNTGGNVTASTGCAVDTSDSKPDLPTGLSVEVVSSGGTRTCQIIGTPVEVVSTARMVTITATNITGSAIVTVSIIVHSGIVPDSLFAQSLFRYEVGRTVSNTRQITFTNPGGDIQSCTASNLPAGMMINSADCTISRKPSRTTAETTTHTITATYTNGATSKATISIETYLSAPPSLSDYSSVTLVVGSAVGLPIVLENTGGLVGENGCQVISNTGSERPLGNFGLELAVTTDSSSCEIRATGTAPTASVLEAGYHIRATNDLGVSGAVATLRIIGASDAVFAPTLAAPAGSPFMFAANTAITPINFVLGGGGLGICTISPALPAGLRLDPSTCQISGTPRTASTITSYTITATNKTSPAATAAVVITVTNATAPSLERMAELGLTLNSNVGLPFAIANTGGSPTTCSAAPTTAGDDALDSYNLTVLVAGGTCVIDSLDGNGPSRVLDGGGFTITASSGTTATLTLNLRAPAIPQIVAGDNRTYAINSARQLFGWGDNSENRLGLGNLQDFLDSISAPTLLAGNDWVQVGGGFRHTCAIKASGQLWCWGSGSSQLGLGNIRNTNTPMRVGGASDWAQISAGRDHTCAIKASGQLWCWGEGNHGRLGLGNNTDINTPMRVGGASDWMQVSAGRSHTCAIKASGQMWCWGNSRFGRLGLGNNADTNTPMRVGGASDWAQISAGRRHTCAIKTSGQMWCWGRGENDQLGLGNNTDTNTPTRVGDASDWMQVSGSDDHTCAIKTSGQLWCWGLDDSGRLGLDNNSDTNTPARVGGASDWMQVSAGANHTCAIKTSGRLFCWGYGEDGRLGLGSNVSANTPALVRGILLRLNITVNPAAPNLQAPGAQSYPTKTPVNVELVNNGVGKLTGCSANNPLPNGLSVTTNTGNDSCVITGIPDTITTAADFEITATNITGSSTITVSIAVVSGVASFADPGPLVYVVGEVINQSFINTNAVGSRISGCTGTLPAGLSVDAIASPGNGCALTGTAATITAQANYTITAANDNGDAALTLGITVNPAAPVLIDTTTMHTIIEGGSVGTVALVNSGGELDACQFVNPIDGTGNTLVSMFDGISVAVAANNTDCEITGSLSGTGIKEFTVRATNISGTDDTTVSITVNPAAPILQELAAQNYPTKAPVNVELVNNGGDELTECTVNNPLPNGLSVTTNAGNDSCVITGIPDAITTVADFEITATNITGSSTITVSIAVVSGVASFVDPGPLVYVVGEVINQSFINTNAAGSRISGCTGTLPGGLSVDALALPGNGCALTGTPTTITAQANYTITTTNDNGDALLTLDITVNPAAPNLNTVNAQVYALNTAITALVLTNTGGDVTAGTGCVIDTSDGKPALPNGLRVGVVSSGDTRTCQITGTPVEVVSTVRMVTIAATNVTGSGTVTVSITVNPGIAPDSLSAQSLFRYEAGRTVSGTRQITFTNLGGAIQSCTASDLPDGMMINSTDCTISGAPSRTTAETTAHTITATYTDNTTSEATISIETYFSAPPSLSDYSSVTLVVGSAVGLPIVLENTGGLVGENGCQVISNTGSERPLSNFGLELAVTGNNSSCEIRAINTASAAPTASVEETEYRITATNDVGVSGAVATLRIIGTGDTLAAPALTAPAGSPFTFATNTAITPIDFGLGGGGLGICTISPALPAGLRFDPSTCQISGTPRMALTETSYTVTATNNTSPAATATVVITVTDAAAALERMIELNLTLNSSVGLPFAIANTGGNPTTCTAAPTTAGDDALDSYNLTVLVAEGTCVIDSLDGNGPSRTLDGGSFTITASSGATTTLTLSLRSPATPQITAAGGRTYAINSAGQLFGWGSNSENRLGLGDLGDSLPSTSTPTLLTGNDWKRVSAGKDHTCAINASGQLFCWGVGEDGQLGLGNDNNTNAPTRVGMGSDWVQVSTGAIHTCAIKVSGQLFCWGADGVDAYGLGVFNINTPTQVDEASDWRQVSTGRDHTCAIKVSGQLWCWGFNNSGQLGLGNDRFAHDTPTRAGSDSDWAQVNAGASHTCAIKTSGQLWCWGAGVSGRLGLGNDIIIINTPMRVGSASDWMQVNGGSAHTCAINASRQLWCWGSSNRGQLGLGNNSNTNTPTQVGDDSDWMQVNAGGSYTCAINTFGQLWCWGNGTNGQLGLGSNTSTNTPALLHLDITVNPPAPILQALGAQSYPTGALVNAELVNAGGGKLMECTVNNPLPNGLIVTTNAGNDSCVIAGTPDAATVVADYDITATNITNSSTITVSIAVVSGVASFVAPEALVYAVSDSVNESFANTNAAGSRVSACVPTGALPDGLSVDAIASPGNGCALTGTPTTITAQADYPITATNDNGDSLPLILDITVNPSAPSLQALAGQRYPTGAPVNVELVNAGGGELTGCTVNNTLPNGLSLTANAGNDSCVIAGTPDTPTAAADYEITATNITDPSTVTVSIAVVSGVASFTDPGSLVYVVGEVISQNFVNTNTSGSRVSACMPTDALPAGLSIGAIASPGNGCVLTGTANTITAQASYTITATNGNGGATLTLDITVNPVVPNLQALGAQSYPTGALVNVELVNAGGGELMECTVNNPLPNGLSVTTNAGNDSCVIAGTPDAATVVADYDITATNITDSSTVTVSIAVVSGVASFTDPGSLVYVVGEAINQNFVNINTSGSRVSACMPTDALPAGLSIDAIASPGNGCVLTGTANTITAQASYTITATNGNGGATLTLDITVNRGAPNLGTVNAQVYAPNTAITPLVFTNTGSDVTASTGCTVDTSDDKPDLPDGLSVGVVRSGGKITCQITGTPTTITAQASYTITASNTIGSDSVTVSIIVNSGIVPDSLSAQALFRYEAGRTVSDTRQITFVNAGGTIQSCAASDLPDGMMINSTDCTISGAPSRTTVETTVHTITATHTDSTTSGATIFIETYLSAPPSLSDYSSVSLVVGSAVGLPIVLENSGGLVGENGCQVTSGGQRLLSNFGLELAATDDSSSCEIRAVNTAPTAPVTQTRYRITATNNLGVSGAVVATLRIIGAGDSLVAPTLTAPAGSPFEFATNTAITPIDFVLGGGGLGICTINPILPAGLRFDPSTCQISGTPRMALTMTSYTVTATNNISPPATATVSITVTNAAAPSLERMVALNLTLNSNVGLPFVIANTGGSPTTCTATPTTAGDDALDSYNLTTFVAGSTCVIDSLDGNGPSRTLDGGSFTITASSGATTTLTFNLRSPATPQISAGSFHTFAINSARQLFGWGNNSENRLGLGDSLGSISAPALLTGNDWAQVSAGTFHTCAIKASGQLWCWGEGGSGRLGLGNSRSTSTPMRVGDASDWMQVNAGNDHTCAIKESGQLWCWGFGGSGRLGLGVIDNDDDDVIDNTNTPTRVGDASDWMKVSGGEDHTCAIKTSGQLLCWGSNLEGQLGLGNNADTNAPGRVGRASDWMQVSAGFTHTCAINESGQLWCWGRGLLGQLGLGDSIDTDTPGRVGDASDWMQVSAGDFHTCAIKASGQLWCWGRGLLGRLGLGNNSSTNTPARVGDASDWMQVGAGGSHTCAIKTSGQPWCWGAGSVGRLGLGSNTDRNTPALVRLDLTANPVAPNLQAPDAQSYPTGTPVSVELVNNGGGKLTECSVNHPLPNGLSMARNAGNDSCVITGTPDTATTAADFEITGTNITGSSTVTISIAVVSGVASFATPGPLVYVVGDSVNESFDNTNAVANRVSSCTGALPAGLSVDALAPPDNGCALTGTPTTITPQASYTITATNASGDTSLTLEITVNPTAPRLSAVNAQVYATNTAITALVLTNTGGDVTAGTGCTVDTSANKPDLATGLSVGVVSSGGTRTCQITGTPTGMISTVRMVTIIASHTTGSGSVTVSITVNSGIVPDNLSARSLFRYEAGRAVSSTRQITFTNIGGTIQSCAAPDLPDGMMINNTNCTISGAPSRPTVERTTHTITATYMDMTTSEATIFIETYLTAPPSLSGYSSVTLAVGSAVGLPIVLENTGGLVGENGCQAILDNTADERPLSNFGLELAVTADSRSCEIRAVDTAPTAPAGETRYRIIATNDVGISGVVVATLRIIGASESLVAPTLRAPASPFTFATNKAITPIDFAPGGDGLGICTISPVLPAGLRLDPSTCQISGTPRTALAMTTYTVTASNKASSADATVAITITDTAAALERMVALNLTLNSNVGLPFAIANTGGSPTTCTATPATAGDDALDSYNLTARVVGGTCVIDSLDGNGPSRELDGGSFTITASSSSTTTLTLNLRTPITPQIVAGVGRTYFINSAGQLFGWGSNFENRLGLGNLDDFRDSVSAPALLTGNNWAQVASSGSNTSNGIHTCAIKTSGQLFCWGDGGGGQLGLGNNRDTNTPMRVGSASDWMQISASSGHTCAIKASGQLWCWGLGSFGRLGLGGGNQGRLFSTNTPMRVGDASDWVQVSAGSAHTCAIKTSGQLWCWGFGGSGRLGLGNSNSVNTPMRVGSASDWAQVSAGSGHTCAIKASGQLWCWGYGSRGQLGLGNNRSTNTPMRVGRASDWMQVSGGFYHTCAIKASGQLWCWGYGSRGQLGLGNNRSTNTPMRVGRASDWMQVSGGNDHTCAINTSGQPWCWGAGSSGQLGLGSNTSTNTPALVRGILLRLGVASFSTIDPLVYAVGDSVNESFTNTNAVGNRISSCTGALPDGLSIDAIASPGNGCVLTGTATAVTAQSSYTITATTTSGDTLLTLNITVNPAAPNLQAPDAQSYPTGAPVNVELVNNGGGKLAECSANSSLPNGLSVARNAGTDSCVITGTPDTITTAADFEITATNITGSSTVTVNIIVVSVVASFTDPGSLVYVVGEVINQNFVNTNTSGGKVSACMPIGALPAGLSIDAIASPGNGCVLAGTANTITAQASYTITATNGNGDAPLTLDITVNPATPNLSAVDAQAYTPNTAITNLVLTNTGGDVAASTGCTVDTSGGKPNLPNGLSVGVASSGGKRTCQITGTPTGMVSTVRTVTITATNITGSAIVTVAIIVNSGIAPDSLSGQALFRYEAGRTVSDTRQITFTNIGGAIQSCTASDLPDGMMINSADCTISSVPSRTMAETTTHTITATYTDGTTSQAIIFIETYFSAPPSLSDYSSVTLVVGSAVGLPIVLENTGGLVGENGCQVISDNAGGQRPLSNFGLELAATDDSSSCEIRATGTAPTATIAETGYRITATNNLGVSGAAVATLTIIGVDTALDAPTLTAPAGSPFMFATNTAITPIDFTLGGGGLGICTISPALPTGLRFDPSTCQISGTPRMALAMTSYTVTASNKTPPAATATVVITVTDAAAALERMVELSLTLNSSVGLPFAIANTGGNPTTCTAAPTTAGGNALDSYNLTVLVAEGTCVIDSLDGNGPSRTLDGGSFTITASSGTTTTLTLSLRNPAPPQIAAAGGRTYAINSAGQLFGWGSNSENRLGLGDLGDSLPSTSTPTLLTGNDWKRVSAGKDHTCAIKASGQLFCWGVGEDGQLGLGNDNNTNAPTRVGMGSDWRQVSTGAIHTCAIKVSGQLFCWGADGVDAYGLGVFNINTPTQVDEASDWRQVSTGRDHTCAIKVSGQLWCWGFNNSGQLGLGNDRFAHDTPTQAGSDSDWAKVNAGASHTCAIKTSGQLWCWGAGVSGRLGLGNDIIIINTPMRVGSASDWMQVNAGSAHTCAIKTSGQLWCWGSSNRGQLGLGNNSNTNTPTQVDDDSDWMQVNAGGSYTCAIETSGQLWCWGNGTNGQLGLGNNTSTNTPTRLPGILLQ